MQIIGLDGMTDDELATELGNGARFVIYSYTFSIIIMTFKRPTDIYFVRAGQSRAAKGLKFTLLTMLVGWWGIPWGPIYSLGSIFGNLTGTDVTTDVRKSLRPPTPRRRPQPVAAET